MTFTIQFTFVEGATDEDKANSVDFANASLTEANESDIPAYIKSIIFTREDIATE